MCHPPRSDDSYSLPAYRDEGLLSGGIGELSTRDCPFSVLMSLNNGMSASLGVNRSERSQA
ncbi:MAG: hypothetical protein WBB28_12395 [Crinalium sp.]